MEHSHSLWVVGLVPSTRPFFGRRIYLSLKVEFQLTREATERIHPNVASRGDWPHKSANYST